MSDSNQQPENEQAAAVSTAKPAGSVASSSRRRLLKFGSAAVPVAATLASKPALAWDCMSPSAWGSEQINPNTSLKGDTKAHPKFTDETWTCVQWAGNTTRNGVSGAPWTKLFAAYGALSTACGGDYTKVTVLMLKQNIPTFVIPKGLGNTVRPCRAKISNVWVDGILTSGSGYTDFQKLALIAQLNYLLLGKDLSWKACLKRPTDGAGAVVPKALQDMATNGQFVPVPGVTWNDAGIAQYLSANYIAKIS